MSKEILNQNQLEILMGLIMENWNHELFSWEIELCMDEQGYAYFKEEGKDE